MAGNTAPGSEADGIVLELADTVQQMQTRLAQLLDQITNEVLITDCLAVNDKLIDSIAKFREWEQRPQAQGSATGTTAGAATTSGAAVSAGPAPLISLTPSDESWNPFAGAGASASSGPPSPQSRSPRTRASPSSMRPPGSPGRAVTPPPVTAEQFSLGLAASGLHPVSQQQQPPPYQSQQPIQPHTTQQPQQQQQPLHRPQQPMITPPAMNDDSSQLVNLHGANKESSPGDEQPFDMFAETRANFDQRVKQQVTVDYAANSYASTNRTMTGALFTRGSEEALMDSKSLVPVQPAAPTRDSMLAELDPLNQPSESGRPLRPKNARQLQMDETEDDPFGL
jgi:hypothetical protein